MNKSSMLIGALLFVVFGFGQNEETGSKRTHIDVHYFHRTERCMTCLSIEENTKDVLDQYFGEELKDGTISFYSICYEGEEDIEAIDKFKADAPALYLTKIKKGKETHKDLTDFAFGNSLHNPDKFKRGLRDKINELLR